jgi:hemerythrin
VDYFPWKDEYSVGIFEIDSQHRSLISILNRLHAQMWDKDGPERLDAAIDELVDYTQTHFRFEEALLERWGYPKLAEHRAVHEKLTKEVGEFKASLGGARPVNQTELIPFLKEWLTHHILEQDRDYAPYIVE